MVRTQECLHLGNALSKAPSPRSGPPDQQAACLARNDSAWPPSASSCCTCLALVPGEGQQLLVGTAAGSVLRGARVGRPPPPREFAPRELRPAALWVAAERAAGSNAGAAAHITSGGGCGGCEALSAAVTCIDVSPFAPAAFLSGRADGSMALHLLGWSGAARVWAAAGQGPMVAVRWVWGRTTVDCVPPGS